MNDFLYCYLSPFLVGLLTVVAVIFGALMVGWLLILIGTFISEKYNHNIPYYSKVNTAVRGIGTWAYRIVMTLVGIVFASLVGMLFWQVGIDILKRFACK